MNRRLLLIENEQVHSPYAEAYRILRTNIQFSKTDGMLKSILFTSSISGEGKSVSVANTAIALAKAGKRVIVLDCDFRKPVQHTIFGRTDVGITNVLYGDYSLSSVIQETDIENLRLLASGPIPPNPSELLGSGRMQDMLTQLYRETDCVLIDSPPVLPVTDACVIAPKVDGVVLIIGAGLISPEMARSVKENLEKVGAHILGVMINRVPVEEEYGYSYRYYGEKAAK